MINEYHRPNTLEEALELLARDQPHTIPMGGGSMINRPSKQEVAVVDLQALKLDSFQRRGNSLHLGATLTLQSFLEYVRAAGAKNKKVFPALSKAIQHEATQNLRQVATLAGTLVGADGRSPFTTLLLAMDAKLILQPGDEQISLGNLLPQRVERLRGRLATEVVLPLKIGGCYEYVARTPADLPIVCVGLAAWPSGRTRVALGGFGAAPTLAFDGGDADGVLTAARSAYSLAEDEWASAEYRQEMAVVLAGRCLQNIDNGD